MRKCQCLSFNFNEVMKNEKCELNDANTKLVPETLKGKERGIIYYEPIRSNNDNNVGIYFMCMKKWCILFYPRTSLSNDF